MDLGEKNYLEITNLGDTAINLSIIEIGQIRPWGPAPGNEFEPETGRRFWLPDYDLGPGESYVIASIKDWGPEQYIKQVKMFGYSPDHAAWEHHVEMEELADIQIHSPEDPLRLDPTDSISVIAGNENVHYIFSDSWNRECWYLRHHMPNGDSAVIDQVGGVFDDPATGRNYAHAYDVAGVTDATGNSHLIRKFVVKEGNLVFAEGKGTDIVDSEWLPIPVLNRGDGLHPFRVPFWTVGNHGNYTIVDTTLVSENVDVNLIDTVLTVAWGVRGDDSLMYQFDRRPGLAWAYDYAENTEDSAYVSCRTGDKLTVYALGNTMQKMVFDIVVSAPPVDANIVIQKNHKDGDGLYENGYNLYEVTDGLAMDTISNVLFATRIDTLYKYLEKAPNATWEIDWVDDVVRTDVKNGDILKVTAEDGTSVKDYFLKVSNYRESLDGYLSAITWPDIPDKVFYEVVYNWTGDTIPAFTSGKLSYSIPLPFDIAGVPALVPTPRDLNTTVETSRAANLTGSVEDRTTTFVTTADDDTTQFTYTVVFSKEKNLADLQSWPGAEPIISEVIFWEQWYNGFIEVANPGTEPLDLSNYMFWAWGGQTPVEGIEWPGDDLTGTTHSFRYNKYIPGYKWTADSNEWKVEPYIAELDNTVSPVIAGGDVMVFAGVATTGNVYGVYPKDGPVPWPVLANTDVLFMHPDSDNQWGDQTIQNISGDGVWCRHWYGNIYMFKILNDSVQKGLKSATDPNDFLLIESFGGNGNDWAPDGSAMAMITTAIRKPEFYLPKAGFEESWGPTPEHDSCEWTTFHYGYFGDLGYGWPEQILATTDDFGSHFMNDVTIYRSTVSSNSYIVSSGFSMDETILGVVDGTTAAQFEANIIKADTGQVLTYWGSAGILAADDVLADEDTLMVVSNDGVNTTKYILDVTAGGLSDDALLTSTEYTVAATGEEGTIVGMEYGTTLKTVKGNVTVPVGATLTIVDGDNAPIPLVKLNYDTNYVDVQVTDDIYFECIAQDGATIITFQLKPTALASDAFVYSDILTIDQDKAIIDFIPLGTTVPVLFGHLVTSPGAEIVLVDKLGMERTFGEVSRDDKLIVTSDDETVTKVYYLSMLPVDEENVVLYLAYVLSDVYDVDQVELTIEGETDLDTDTDVSAFVANVTPAAGATVMVVDNLDVENTGTLASGDLLKVTAGDGVTTAYYSLDVFITSTGALNNGSAIVYPNPSTGMITVSGIEAGNRIRVYNMLGSAVHDVIANQADEVISLESQPNGIYFVVVGDGDETIGRYKLILE